MKNKIALLITTISLSLAVTNEVKAQATLPYFTGFDNATHKAGWQIIRKGAVEPSKWEYTTQLPFSGTESISHAYPVGGTVAMDDWFVSPSFNIPAGGFLDSIRHSFSGFGTPAAGDTVAIYLLTGNADPALATSKVMLYDFRGTNYNNDMTWKQTLNLTLPPSAAACYLAIRYKTVNNWLDVKFDNIRIRGKAPTAINEPNIKKVVVAISPNPANDFINIETKENIKEVLISDLNGRVVYSKAFSKTINLSNFKTGMYLISCITASGNRINGTFVKN